MKWNQRMSEALLTAHDSEDDVECQFCAKETHSLFGLSWGVSAPAEGGEKEEKGQGQAERGRAFCQ